MIEIGGTPYAFDDPSVIASLVGAGLVLLILLLLVMALSAARRSARMAEPLVYQLNELGKAVQGLSQNQHHLDREDRSRV